ncbi:MAG: HAMP domain-containing histidine kinase [Clostridia bacterium]|nr:HAMP domain-containing histidine kinase [Clostridia bacterium]
MFKSIFTKYLTVFMTIVCISFIILTVIVSSMFVDYTVEEKRDMIERCSTAVVNYMRNDCQIVDEATFIQALDVKYNSIESFISLISPLEDELFIMLCDSEGLIYNIDSSLTHGHLPDNIPADVVALLKDSSSTTVLDLDEIFREKHYCYGTPYFGENNEFLGAVIVCSSSEVMSEMVQMLIKTIIMTSLWVLVIVLVTVYILSERQVAPIKNMSYIAKKFASGDFESRVEVKGRDELAQLAVSFNNMAEQLAVLEDTRRTFLVNVAHDLRTPMTTIGGFIDGIRDGAIPEEKQEYYLTLISDEVKRLSRLVALLLDVSRIEAGDRKFTPVNFDICEMARMILISFESKLDEKKLDVEFDCENDNMFVFADKDAIHQVLYNICHNAIKFSYDGGKYRIRINRMDKRIYVSVFNEGVGMPPEDLAHVFDRFYKSDKSRGLDKTGVGLGMYITKTIINAHEQDIWVKSVYNEYCEFVFTLKEGDKKNKQRNN